MRSSSLPLDPVLADDWHVVARASDLASGGVKAARLLGMDLVLWRNVEGVHAWEDLCIHRGAKFSLGRVKEDCLVCPYHGWEYEATGRCVRIPAHPQLNPPERARANTFLCREKYGLVWVCLGKTDRELPEIRHWDEPFASRAEAGPYVFKAAAPRALENFVDIAHFAFLHAGLLGDPDHPEMEDYEVTYTREEGVFAPLIHIYQPHPDGKSHGGLIPFAYRIPRPLTTQLETLTDNPKFTVWFTVTPVDAGTSIGWVWLFYNLPVPPEALRAREDVILAQDVPIVESQRPELLPLDLQAELHLRSDRVAIAYRQWLGELGLTFGTA
jgi:phenylpropionate dioxygenase-like ring-hydroxylating dioxygenase large terminal subunit